MILRSATGISLTVDFRGTRDGGRMVKSFPRATSVDVIAPEDLHAGLVLVYEDTDVVAVYPWEYVCALQRLETDRR